MGRERERKRGAGDRDRGVGEREGYKTCQLGSLVFRSGSEEYIPSLTPVIDQA